MIEFILLKLQDCATILLTDFTTGSFGLCSETSCLKKNVLRKSL